MKRGDIFQAKLNPTEGSEQGGIRPVVVVSRDAINESSPVVIVVPLTDRKNKAKIYPSQIVLKAGEGRLPMESVALGEQVRSISKTRLGNQIGHLAPHSMAAIGAALKIALDLP
ncbi:MAG: PemK family transcriptional regulator [Acidobacteria bacterium RIFCSPLOWO2_12_FULL_59_11]|nr:MAG: PemK family transcriptional regulator [Acidobacteria bacterium RIFCSPLOWO2_12_FULL_59_11]